jgi:cell fate regulator YaaT (PSP1 superfamily)
MKDIYIKARSDSKIYLAEKGNLKLETGDMVLFESDQCQEIAFVMPSVPPTSAESESNTGLEKAVLIRRLNDKDQEIDQQKKEEARQNLERCKEIVSKHQLPMELLDADISFDGKKLTFYFSAPGRVDFRSLVSELASTFQKLIRLQQVGSRDRARCIGGIGRCGEDFCCKRFLKGDLESVSVDMSYEQGLGQMGANRVTGACGKLMCCLKYELDNYRDAKAKLPAVGSEIKTPKGKGRILSQCVLKNSVIVELENNTRLEVDCSK